MSTEKRTMIEVRCKGTIKGNRCNRMLFKVEKQSSGDYKKTNINIKCNSCKTISEIRFSEKGIENNVDAKALARTTLGI